MRVRGYAPGTPCWAEVASPDPVAARAFYGGLFGWQFNDDGHFTHNGRAVAGKVAAAHDPPLRGAEHDRVPRAGESYVKDFKPLSLGTVELPAGRGLLTLRATKVPGKQVSWPRRDCTHWTTTSSSSRRTMPTHASSPRLWGCPLPMSRRTSW